MRPGRGMGGMREVISGIVAGPVGAVGVDLFVVWGGICDLSVKGYRGKISRRVGGVQLAIRELGLLNGMCQRAGVRVLFATIPPVNFGLHNNGVASITPAQTLHEQDVISFNNQLVRTNIRNCFSTPLVHTTVMRKKKQRHCFLWSNTVDGVHLIPYQVTKVSNIIMKAIRKNVNRMHGMIRERERWEQWV